MPPAWPFSIRVADGAHDIAAVAELFDAYARSLGIDLAYQGFAAELASLPGRYAPPKGALLIARSDDGAAAGCVGLRALADAGCCEMKRLFVAPRARGRGLGHTLVAAIVSEATRRGYRTLRLDTLATMQDAAALYLASGFVETAPYYETPIAGTRFFARALP